MSVADLEAHAAALLALLRGDPLLLNVHDGHVPANPALPYCVLYLGWDAERTALAAVTDQFSGIAQITSVGANASAARIVAKRVADRLIDIAPAVAGRTCWPITHELGQPPREDRDVHIDGIGFPIYTVDQYRIASVPA